MSCVLLVINLISLSTYEILLVIIIHIFYFCSYCSFDFLSDFFLNGFHVKFISILGLLNVSLYLKISIAFLRHLILECSSLFIILTSSLKSRWFPFSFHIWLTIPNFLVSLQHMAFHCSSSFTFSRWHILPFYTLSQLHGMEYRQFLVMLYSFGGLTWKRYFWRVEPLLNVILISYGLNIFWIFLASPLI